MNFLDLAFLFTALRLATPLLLAALGGVLSERVGVVALHLEAMMLGGAFASVAAAVATGSVWMGLLAGVLTGALLGLLHGVLTQVFRLSPILSGVALNLGTLGFTTYALRQSAEPLSLRAGLPPWLLPLLSGLLVAALWFLLTRTVLGLRWLACGENPRAAVAAGLSVVRLRYGALALSGGLAGLGGVALTLTGLGAFTENMTAGRGYIALAAVIFGRWDVRWAALAALGFGAGDALQLSLQTAGLSRLVPSDLLSLFPYLLTLLALAVFSTRGAAPAALNESP